MARKAKPVMYQEVTIKGTITAIGEDGHLRVTVNEYSDIYINWRETEEGK